MSFLHVQHEEINFTLSATKIFKHNEQQTYFSIKQKLRVVVQKML